VRPLAGSTGFLAREPRRGIDHDAAGVVAAGSHGDRKGALAIEKRPPLVGGHAVELVGILADEADLREHPARLEECLARERRGVRHERVAIVRDGGEADAAERNVVEDELNRRGRGDVRRAGAVVGAPQAGVEEARLRFVLVGDDDRLAVLAHRHSERLARHRDVTRVAPLVGVGAGLMDRVATAGAVLPALEDERAVRDRLVERRNRARGVALDAGPRDRGVASHRGIEAVEASVASRLGALELRRRRREQQVGRERADDRRIANVEARVDRRRADLPERSSRCTAVRAERLPRLVDELRAIEHGDLGRRGIRDEPHRVTANEREVVRLEGAAVELEVEVRVDGVEDGASGRHAKTDGVVEPVERWRGAVTGRVAVGRSEHQKREDDQPSPRARATRLFYGTATHSRRSLVCVVRGMQKVSPARNTCAARRVRGESQFENNDAALALLGLLPPLRRHGG
jgi:hypothetical protein